MYRRMYPEVSETDTNDLVTYNPITRKVTFKNLGLFRYLIVAPADSSIISMLGHGSRTTAITPLSKCVLEVLPIEKI